MMEVTDENIKIMLEDYDFIIPGDKIRIYLKREIDGQRFIEGELLSIVPVYMIEENNGRIHSLKDVVDDVVLVERGGVDRNFERIMRLRDQAKKSFIIGAFMQGGMVMQQPTMDGCKPQLPGINAYA